MTRIPLNRPSVEGRELIYIRDAIRRGHLSGDGFYTQRCSRLLESYLPAPRVLLTPSCTHALEMAFILLGIQKNDEVLLPSFTFPSTANAFVLRGARPTFIDIRPDTLNMDERLLEAQFTPRTRAISPIHYAGVPAQMDVIMALAKKHRVAVVEDAAQALGATFSGKRVGTFGDVNAFSFHETKNCGCGEGGALVIRSRALIKRAEILRQNGTNREQFYRGEVDKYSWVDVGSSYLPSELQSAYLWGQLECLKQIHRKRATLYAVYMQHLKRYESKGRLRLPVIPNDRTSSYHLFYILLDDLHDRNRVMKELQRRGILSVFHYFPLHLSKMGRTFGYRPGQLPISEDISNRLLRLPLYNSMTAREQHSVIHALSRIL